MRCARSSLITTARSMPVLKEVSISKAMIPRLYKSTCARGVATLSGGCEGQRETEPSRSRQRDGSIDGTGERLKHATFRQRTRCCAKAFGFDIETMLMDKICVQ